MRRLCLLALGALIGLVLTAAVFVAAVLSLVRATPGVWSEPVRIGAWHMDVGVPAALRMATHPVVMRAAQHRVWATPYGPIRLHAGAQADTWALLCSPCRVPVSQRDAQHIELSRVELIAHRVAQNEWQGDFVLGESARAVRGRFKASFDDRGAELRFILPDTPIAHVYQLFAKVIPEVSKAQIDGRVRLNATVRLPRRVVIVDPVVDGFSVAGLGTEALMNAAPSCEAPGRGFGSWLPRAVVAAEDQRFYEHAGYDIKEIAAALTQGLPAADAPRGASTITQQLAKLLYTGDSRTHVRKLRELLYAVELDRTLGKARVLNLYLAMAPWGDGQCGAAAAARHYLHKRVDKLTPMEAAWLASLLHNPDRDWAAYSRSGQVDVKRVAWVISNLRPMGASNRESLIDSLPQWRPDLKADAKTAPR